MDKGAPEYAICSDPMDRLWIRYYFFPNKFRKGGNPGTEITLLNIRNRQGFAPTSLYVRLIGSPSWFCDVSNLPTITTTLTHPVSLSKPWYLPRLDLYFQPVLSVVMSVCVRTCVRLYMYACVVNDIFGLFFIIVWSLIRILNDKPGCVNCLSDSS